jgi:hypothetical protein
MEICKVNDKQSRQLFLEIPTNIYANDPNWIKPLDKEINDVFDEEKNKAYRFGKTERWILRNNDGKWIGRIAAFVNKKYKTKGDDCAVGGIGFFECINNQEAADMLFDNAKHWLLNEGVEAMDGPINFGERDKWWGLVTEGFHPPLYGMNYNLPYYLKLFEDYGFQLFYEQFCFGMKLDKPLQEKIWERHKSVAENPAFTIQNLKKNNLEKYISDFTEVYNKAWAGHGGMKQLAREQVAVIFKKMKPVMDEQIIWFAYHDSQPIGLFVNLPDLNQWFKKLNGKFGLMQKIYFLWLKQFQKNTKFNGLAFGVVPEFQGIGVDSFLIGEAYKSLQANKSNYTDYEMQWIGDFNPKMVNIATRLGDVFLSRKLITMRYLFDRTKTFKRHPVL